MDLVCGLFKPNSKKVSSVGGTKISKQNRKQRRVGAAKSVTPVAWANSRKFFVGGNWKCNGNKDSIKQLVEDLNEGSIPSDVEVVCAPPFLYLDFVQSTLQAPYQVSAQNCWVQKGGAFTGEISAEMLVDNDVHWVILGHSERRQLFQESDEFVAQKCAYALKQGLSIIPCIGETLEQRENGEMFQILEEQLNALKKHITDWSAVVLAYVPVWAIGTGVIATPEQAQEVHQYIRYWFANNVSSQVSSSLRILYGGSVKPDNCVQLAKQKDVDGFLVGGASLSGPDFVKICNANMVASIVSA
eukprot:TRINITY_DN2947_c0_g1_i1.p1 TRINITY_DN2947_c0_g1~~TRINITY_DN2947_c0_g1_i1.p1  ORF type:complete len:354 (-),score=70.36 TRINITY_DN2947_c0_g1_i1:79-981(-)